MKTITGSPKVFQGAGQTQVTTVRTPLIWSGRQQGETGARKNDYIQGIIPAVRRGRGSRGVGCVIAVPPQEHALAVDHDLPTLIA